MTGAGRRLGRRAVLRGAAAALLGPSLPAPSLAAPSLARGARPRVVIVGGGAGGATLARLLPAQLDVTLIEASPIYQSCFFSNLALGGFLPFEALAHDYGALTAQDVRLILGRATAIDPATRAVHIGPEHISYDRLVLAPGIDYRPDALPGWSEDDPRLLPPMWKSGERPERLRQALLDMRPGGTFCLIAPPAPYRCPPAPYERVSMAASLLKQHNPTARILILDAKPSFAKQALFEEGWQTHYPGMIERLGPDMGADILELSVGAHQVIVDGMEEGYDLLNVIPPQQAGAIAQAAGVVDASGWAPVDPASLRARLNPEIFVLGDAGQPGAIPKSASAAVSGAAIAAAALAGDLLGQTGPAAGPRPGYDSTCYSALAEADSVFEISAYAPRDGTLTRTRHALSQMHESRETRARNWAEAFAWHAGIAARIFG
ncbi:FAD-dependent oxidoreductase [Phaeovulum vinaykumarii]|uniref:Cytochrome-dependent sulfide dehydrogenase (Flavoprotein) n=1 Tax=Phaeovulum vinaykumarii TaxID=407234 RepID=A0A1N7JJ67_9RHOB|nr:FAD-dependent oxidoreductase [Phaeovulum vinaykumarii]SIS49368.1 cytochrome-dependent sulfide dehydrogenase (flavoprotein) [Phaeovulum vinaykumarii]SOB89659.1 cytochrome-dependent sulfide dehydrogenase (flavoprotein) [Phaeovulum vinaykumarii]